MSYQILAVGEVLWDLLPGGKKLGGAPANFAYHCRSLGADGRLVTRVGDDDLGREVIDRFEALALPTEGVQRDPERPTGTVAVELAGDGQPRFTIRDDVAWDRIEPVAADLARASRAAAICFGSLAQRAEPSRSTIRALVAATGPGALRVFDVNLRPPFVDREVIADSLNLANVLKLNEHELPELAAMFGMPTGARESMAGLADRFGLKVVALTRGPLGSLLLADGRWSEHAGLAAAVVDTIGAGDAFTAALVVGTLDGRPLDAINAHANAVAAFVCSQPGGTPALPPELSRIGPNPQEDRP